MDKFSLQPKNLNNIPAYGLAYVAAAVAMMKGDAWTSLVIFMASLLAAVFVEIAKPKAVN